MALYRVQSRHQTVQSTPVPTAGQQSYLDEVQQCFLELQPGERPAGHGGGVPVLQGQEEAGGGSRKFLAS